MDQEQKARIAWLVGIARTANRLVVNAKRTGCRFPSAEYARSKAILDARIARGDTGRDQQSRVRVTLARMADLTCELDEQKNSLPIRYRDPFTQVVEATHDYIKAIAEQHGLTIYMDQREARPHEKQTH